MDRGLRGIALYKDRIFIAASDELFLFDQNWQIVNSYRNPYLKHCHEICLHDGMIFLTSTGFDSILQFDPEKEKFTCGYHLRNTNPNASTTPKFYELTFDPRTKNGPSQGDTIHINNVCSYNGNLYMSSLQLSYLFKLEGDSFKKQATIPFGTHNARPYKNGIIFNNTNNSTVCYINNACASIHEWNIPIYNETNLMNTDLPKDHARQGFGRGLCPLSNDVIVAGSSPATISVYSLQSKKFIKSINLSLDVRNAIHGLEAYT